MSNAVKGLDGCGEVHSKTAQELTSRELRAVALMLYVWK